MKKRIAQWLLKMAKRLDPQKEFVLADVHEPKKLGIGFHITKNDVRKFRKLNSGYTSHRKGLEALIEETKKEINASIVAGLYKNGLITYKVNKSLWTADVVGELYVYNHKSEE